MSLAHAGDIVTSLIMVAPVVVITAWLGIQMLHGKLSGDDEEED